MSLLRSYTLGHLKARKSATVFTVVGVGLVVFVFVCTLMLSNGLEQTLAETGSAENILVTRNGAESEIQSGIQLAQANIVLAMPEVARHQDGSAIVSMDTVVVVSLKRKNDNEPSNVTMRGISASGMEVRKGIAVIEGRAPERGTKEVMVGKAIAEKFKGTEIGATLRIVGTDWPVVGVFDPGPTGFSSEIWGDYDVLRTLFHRDVPSSMTFRLQEHAAVQAFFDRVKTDPRLSLSAARENEFYAAKSRALSMFIRVLGITVSVVFSIGAILGAMITMYGAVASRTREIGILRALGFRSLKVFFVFAVEALAISFVGGLLGVALASTMSFVGITTTNFQTFAVVDFGFRLNWAIGIKGILFALAMGLLGGLLPAFKAAKTPILLALREA